MQIYNTLSGSKEDFVPVEEGKVKIYVCGPTTYNYIHLGNARPLVFFDVVRRYFSFLGYEVVFVQNFTDVDDKIINKAKELKTEPLALAEKYIQEFFRDAGALNVLKADHHPRVSENLQGIVELISILISKEAAYEVNGDVYFRVRSFQEYGKLSGRSLDELQAGARVEVDLKKEDPLDFALWKKAKEGEIAWDSPWGLGRPGWHIECSVMSLKYLGADFDIHGGGADLIFPHHENEIAQSRAGTGGHFAKYWMHNGFITVNQAKMSKSLGNFFLVRDILAKFPAEVIRFFLLETHYRSPLDFDDQKLKESQKALDRIKKTGQLLQEKISFLEGNPASKQNTGREVLGQKGAECRENFIMAMNDDFNTAKALGFIFEFCRECNSFANLEQLAVQPKALMQLKEAARLLEELMEQVLGVPIGVENNRLEDGNEALLAGLIQLAIDLRQGARAKKDWQIADEIRNRLHGLGIILEDTPHGVRWKKGQ
ncbi:MAG: cysteine--tRNA ligase [Bacillota bacterium]